MSADPELRASDAERRRVAELLRIHYLDGRLTQDDFAERVEHALAARTQGELAELTRDLPQEAPAPPQASVRRRRKTSVHVIGGFAREERGLAQDEYLFVSGLGGLDLDLSDAQIPPGGVDVEVWSVIGGVALTVPEGVTVEHSGFSVLGGIDDGTRGAPAGSPTVRLTFYSLIGGAAVEPPGGPRRRRLSRRPRHRGLPPPPRL
jgi:DUF1707 SHOCT-like domain